MSRSIANVQSGDSSIQLINNVETNNNSTINAANLNITESISLEGQINANDLIVEESELGDIKVSQNNITLKAGSIYSTLNIEASNIRLVGNLSVENTDIVSFTNIQTKDLLITDPVASIATNNNDTVSDRGFLLNYIDADTSESILAFLGISNEDKIFRLFSSVPVADINTPNLFYNSENRDEQTLGDLEIENLLCKKIIPQVNDSEITIESDSIIMGIDSGLITMKSNVSFEGETNFKFVSFFNTDVVTMADKNLGLYIDDASKIISIIEDSDNPGNYIITLEEESVNLTAGTIVAIDELTGINNSYFNKVHVIYSRPDSLNLIIQLESGIDLSNLGLSACYIGKVLEQSNLNDSGIIVYGFKRNIQNDLIETKKFFQYKYNSDQPDDSDWFINQNLRTTNTILLKKQNEIFDTREDHGRIMIKDDGELYYDFNNIHHKITNQQDEIISNINFFSISNDEHSIYSYHKIGVNTTNPEKDLDVNGDARIRNNIFVDKSIYLGINNSYLDVDTDGNIYYYDKNGIKHEILNDLMDQHYDGLLVLTNWKLSSDENSIYSHQRVGINTTNPEKDLDVNGDARIRNNMFVDKSLYLGINNSYLNVDTDGNIYYYDKNGLRHEILNDLMDQHYDDLLVLTNWKLSSDENSIYSHQQVGINTTNPEKDLDVNGDARIRNNMYIDKSLYLGINNSYLDVDTDGNIYYYDKNGIKHEILNDLMDQHYDGLLVLTNWKLSSDENSIYSHQRVGINTTNPEKDLDVNGDARIRNNMYVDKSIYLGINNSYLDVDTDGNIYYNDKNGIRHEILNDLMDQHYDDLLVLTNWKLSSDEKSIYSHQLVGINTTNPEKDLDVNGDARIQNSLIVNKFIYIGEDEQNYIKLEDDNIIYFYSKNGLKYNIINENIDSQLNLSLWSLTNDERSIYASHKVGIGVTNPKNELDVSGDISVSNNLYVSNGIYLDTNSLQVKDDNNLYYNNGLIETKINDVSSNFEFENISSWSFTGDHNDLYTFSNLGIGTSLPSTNLDINGNARFRLIGSGASSGVLHYTSNGTLTVATSDKRLKKNIENINYGLKEVNKLNPCSFYWKDGGNCKKIGLIAQEVKEIIPEATFVNDNTGYMGIHDNHIMAVLINAIKEQNNIINEQRNSIRFLEQKNADYENRLCNLESLINNKFKDI